MTSIINPANLSTNEEYYINKGRTSVLIQTAVKQTQSRHYHSLKAHVTLGSNG